MGPATRFYFHLNKRLRKTATVMFMSVMRATENWRQNGLVCHHHVILAINTFRLQYLGSIWLGTEIQEILAMIHVIKKYIFH